MLSNQELERYSRQMLIEEIGYEGQKKLKYGRVLVIGAGGLGSPALLYLAAAGVGTIGIADFDCVDLSNLQRQILHTTDRIGVPKTESAEKTLRALNPEVRFIRISDRITPENITGLIRDYDIVLDCTDGMENKLMINDACVKSEKPFVHAGVLGTSGQIMTWIPGGNYPCFRCIAGNEPADDSCESCAVMGVLGAATGTAGSLQAAEAIKYLTGAGDLLTGRILFFDLLRQDFTVLDIPERSPYCSACGKQERTA